MTNIHGDLIPAENCIYLLSRTFGCSLYERTDSLVSRGLAIGRTDILLAIKDSSIQNDTNIEGNI